MLMEVGYALLWRLTPCPKLNTDFSFTFTQVHSYLFNFYCHLLQISLSFILYYLKLFEMSASFASECTDAKKAYDNCFNEWYSEKFLKAKSVTNECEETWKIYESCVHVSTFFLQRHL